MSAEPTLGAFFGNNAAQDANTLTITKADLVPASSGNPPVVPYQFTPSTATGNTEALAVALLQRWRLNQDTSPDAQLVFGNWDMSLQFRAGQYQRRYRLTIDVYVNDNQKTTPNPDDVVG